MASRDSRYGISTTAGYKIGLRGRRGPWEAEAGVYDCLTGQRLATFTRSLHSWRKESPGARREADAEVRAQAEEALRAFIAEDRADG